MKKILAAAALFISSTALAYSMPSIEGGFKWGSAKQTGSSSDKQDIAFQLGGSVVVDIAGQLGLKTGLFYSERAFKSEFGATTGKGKITYFEVPALFMFKLEDYAGVYAGPSVAVKLGDEYTPGSLSGVKDMVVPVTLGAQFKFTPQLGINVFFETLPGEMARGVEDYRAVGVNLMFALD